ncbi:MAG: hypothetical protein IJD23_05780 [Spirochaetaceae bacterium]|nr:hypothetical protein [Spirochaetaceae bacterium]
MYIDCFDSVKTQIGLNGVDVAQNNAIFSEAFLFNLLLNGYTPNFTPSQFIDSSIIFNITSTNKDVFIDIINSGFITINLFPDEFSLRNHFVKCLSEGVCNDNSFYDFSIFPFLNNYDKLQRKKMQEKMIKNINNHYTDFHIDGLSNEEAEYMEMVYDNFQVIDILSKKVEKKTKYFTQNMNQLLINFCNEETDLEFIDLYNELKNDNDKKTINSYRRSIFYDFIRRKKDSYSLEVINKIKNYVDCSYNIAIASAVGDKEGTDISSNNSEILNSRTIDNLNPKSQVKFSIRDNKNSKTRITWEDVLEILKEIKKIEIEKKISRKKAMEIYKRKQTFSNVYKLGKYVVGNTIKTLIPGAEFMNAAINIISDVSINATSECFEEKLKMQSIVDLLYDFKKTNKQKKLIDNASKLLNYYSCNFNSL